MIRQLLPTMGAAAVVAAVLLPGAGDRAAAGVGTPLHCGGEGSVRVVDDGLHLSSPYFDVRVSLDRPGFSALVLDGLGEGKFGPNALRPAPTSESPCQVARGDRNDRIWIDYRRSRTDAGRAPGWRFEIGDREIRLISQWSKAERPVPLVLNFDPQRRHVALLGRMDKACSVRLPAILHVPNQGSLRITTPGRFSLCLATMPSKETPTKRTS